MSEREQMEAFYAWLEATPEGMALHTSRDRVVWQAACEWMRAQIEIESRKRCPYNDDDYEGEVPDDDSPCPICGSPENAEFDSPECRCVVKARRAVYALSPSKEQPE